MSMFPETPDTGAPMNPPADDTTPQPKAGLDKVRKKVHGEFKQRIDVCKQYRRKLIANWTVSIDYRRGKPFTSQTDEDRVQVPLDWSLTKSKQASLFSQVPQIHVDHPPQTQQAGPWLSAFEKRINDTIVLAGIDTVMEEVLPAVINAAGIGAALVAHESITEEVEVPSIDLNGFPPDLAASIKASGHMPDGSPVPTTKVPRTIDHRYTIQSISPSDLLWPINFTGADFDLASWIGRSGRISWAEATQRFGLQESDRDAILGEERNTMDRLTHDIDKDKVLADELVGFDEIFYKEMCYDPAARSFYTIHHMVFIAGKDEPVIDEPWKGQQFDPQTNQLLGAFRFPIRVLTLTYITDETIPPSDSAMARPQINELNKSRTMMLLQRERSLPIRWGNVNLLDPAVMQNMMRGTWQAVIPVQGDGSRALGEVARAQMAPESFTIDKIIKGDLGEMWQVQPDQLSGVGGIETKGEAQIVQGNFQTRIGRERAKVAKFFCSIAEVLGGLLAIYEPPESFGQGFDPSVSKTLSYSILADSTVLLDSNQRRQRLQEFINFTAKSGWVNIGPVLKEYATLSGLDPNVVIVPPQPKPPVEPNISLRMTGVEDLLNPLALAMLIKSGQAPPAELIEAAKQLITSAVTPPSQSQPPQGGPGGPMGGPAGPGGPPMPPPPGMAPPPQPLPPALMPHIPPPPPPMIGQAHPNWAAMSKINKRTEEGQ